MLRMGMRGENVCQLHCTGCRSAADHLERGRVESAGDTELFQNIWDLKCPWNLKMAMSSREQHIEFEHSSSGQN